MLPPQESNIHSYLLVITVWERQDGANTALKSTHRRIHSSVGFRSIVYFNHLGHIRSVVIIISSSSKQVFGNLRDISQ